MEKKQQQQHTYGNDLHFNNRLRFAGWRQCEAKPIFRKSSSQLTLTEQQCQKIKIISYSSGSFVRSTIRFVLFFVQFVSPNGNCDSGFGLTFVGVNEKWKDFNCFEFMFGNWSTICNCICILNAWFAIIQQLRHKHCLCIHVWKEWALINDKFTKRYSFGSWIATDSQKSHTNQIIWICELHFINGARNQDEIEMIAPRINYLNL